MCGQEGHKLKDCPSAKHENGNSRTHSTASSATISQNFQKGTIFILMAAKTTYMHFSRQDQENSLDVVASMLKIFSIDVYALLDPDATLSFVTLYVAVKFDFSPEELLEPFSISTLVGDQCWLSEYIEFALSQFFVRIL